MRRTFFRRPRAHSCDVVLMSWCAFPLRRWSPPWVRPSGGVARGSSTRSRTCTRMLHLLSVCCGSDPRSGRALSRLSRGILARADAVVALDGAMAAALEAQGARRVEVIPNWADGARLHPDAAAGARFRSERGLGRSFHRALRGQPRSRASVRRRPRGGEGAGRARAAGAVSVRRRWAAARPSARSSGRVSECGGDGVISPGSG